MKSLGVKKIRNIDNTAIETYKIPRLILMEHAGLEVAKSAARLLDKKESKKIFIFCGAGYNGGDGLVAARHLYNWGYEVVVFLINKENKSKSETLSNLKIVKKLGIEIIKFNSNYLTTLKRRLNYVDLIIDSMLGIGLSGRVRIRVADLIRCLNDSGLPILSVDVPSGLNADTGEEQGVSIKAWNTVTFAAPKKGFFFNSGPEKVGDVLVSDIGIPKKIINEKV